MKKGLTTPFGGIRRAACTLPRKDAWLCRRPLFPRTLLLLLCLFRQSEAQPAGWAFLIPLRHSSFSPQSFAAQTFAGAPPYGLSRKAGIHFITPTQSLKPLGKALPGRFCFCNNTLLPGCGTRVNNRHSGQHTSTIVNRHNAQL